MTDGTEDVIGIQSYGKVHHVRLSEHLIANPTRFSERVGRWIGLVHSALGPLLRL